MDQGVVVCQDGDVGTNQVVPQLFCDGPLHGEELYLHGAVGSLVLLSRAKVSAGIGDDALLAILLLGQYCAEAVVTGICF